MIKIYTKYTGIILSLAILTLFMGTASALVAENPEPTVSIDSNGPYLVNMGNELTLYTTVTVTDLPSEWYDIYSDPERYVDASATVKWDLSGDGVYNNAETDVIDIRLDESTVTLVFESEIDSNYFTSHTTGVYDVEVMALVSISEESLIDFETEEYDSTTVEVINPIVADIGGPYTGTAGNPVILDATGSYDTREIPNPESASTFMIAKRPATGIADYSWDLDGDGEYDDASGSIVEHTFTTSGSYPISLKVTSYDGYSKTASTTVRITDAPGDQIPEFPTIALPIAAIIGLAFIMQRRKD